MLAAAGRRLVRGRGLQPLLLRQFQGTGEQGSAAEPAPEPVPLSKLKDSFLDGTSSTYLEELEERYRANPKSVDKSWASFFHSLGEPRGIGSAVDAAGTRPALGFAPRRRRRLPACLPAACLQPVTRRPALVKHPPLLHPAPGTADMGVPAVAVAEAYDAFEKGEVSSPLTAAAISNQTIQESMRLLLLVRAFQVVGHYAGG